MKVEWWMFPEHQSLVVKKDELKLLGIDLSGFKPLYKLRSFIFWKGRTSVRGLRKLAKIFHISFKKLSECVIGLHQHGGGTIELPYEPNIYSFAVYCHYFFDVSKWEVSYSQNTVGTKVENKENIDRFINIVRKAFPKLKITIEEKTREKATIIRVYTSKIVKYLLQAAYRDRLNFITKEEALALLSCLIVDEGSVELSGYIRIKLKDINLIKLAKKAVKMLNIKCSKIKPNKDGLFSITIHPEGTILLSKLLRKFLTKYPEFNLGSKQRLLEEEVKYLQKASKRKSRSYATKFKILKFLRGEGKTLRNVIFNFLITPSCASVHLNDLVRLKLVKVRKKHQKNFYSLTKLGEKIVNQEVFIAKVSFNEKRHRVHLSIGARFGAGMSYPLKHKELVLIQNIRETANILSYKRGNYIICSKYIFDKLKKLFTNGEIVTINVDESSKPLRIILNKT